MQAPEQSILLQTPPSNVPTQTRVTPIKPAANSNQQRMLAETSEEEDESESDDALAVRRYDERIDNETILLSEQSEEETNEPAENKNASTKTQIDELTSANPAIVVCS